MKPKGELQAISITYNYVQKYEPHWLWNMDHNYGYETHNNDYISV